MAKQSTIDKYVGNTYGVLTVISFDRTENTRSYFNCKCSRCGNITSVRSDRFSSSTYIPQSCSYCINDLQKEIADKKYLEDRPYNQRYNSFVNNAKERNIQIDITKEEAFTLFKQPCYYCGEESTRDNVGGIDRVDSNLGYIKENIVPCCGVCNLIKNKYSLELFYDKVSKIYHKHIKSSSTTIETTSEEFDGKK